MVKASHLIPFIAYLEEISAPVDELLNDVKLSRDYFSAPDNLVPEAPMWAFFELAAERTGVTDLGFKVTEYLSLDSYGVFGEKVMSADNLKRALTVFIDDMGQQSNCPPFWLKESNNGVWFYRLGTQGITRGKWQVEQHVVSLMVQLVRGFTSRHWTPPHVELQTNTLKGAEHCGSLRGSKVVIGKAYTGIFIPSTLLSNQSTQIDQAEIQSKQLPNKDISTINNQVLKSLMSQSNQARYSTIEKVAQTLSMSVRQLQRVLKE